ncbi:MAG: hypothetical protein WB812_09675 [Woeseiaceae bacterium]
MGRVRLALDDLDNLRDDRVWIFHGKQVAVIKAMRDALAGTAL